VTADVEAVAEDSDRDSKDNKKDNTSGAVL